MLDEGLLQRIQPTVLEQPFDRLHRTAVHPDRELAARVDRLAVDEHRAGAALAAIAADLGAGEAEVVAQRLGEGPAIFDPQGARRPVHGHLDRGAGSRR